MGARKATPKAKAGAKKKKTSSHGSEAGTSEAKKLEELTMQLKAAQDAIAVLSIGPKPKSKYVDHPEPIEDLRASWRTWSRQHLDWRSQDFDEKTMVLGMIGKLTKTQTELVHSKLDPPLTAHGVEAIYNILKDNFSGVSMLDAQKDFKSYESHQRKNESLNEFLIAHDILRSRAISSGMIPDDEAGFRLLTAANLDSEKTSTILRELDTRNQLLKDMAAASKKVGFHDDAEEVQPSYQDIREKLMRLSVHNAYIDSRNNTKDAVFLSGGGNRNKVRRQGGIQKKATITVVKTKSAKKREKLRAKIATLTTAAAQQQPGGKKFGFDWICPTCGNSVFDSKSICGFNGCAARRPFDGGKKAPQAAKGNKGGGKGKGAGKGKTQLCRNWQSSGTCRFGGACKFMHDSQMPANPTA